MTQDHATLGQPSPVVTSSSKDGPRSWYVLAMLTLTFAMAYVDRQLLNLQVDAIKSTLAISDTQFSFIQGAAFVLAYLFATPIFGRLVDLSNRRNILMFGACVWSISTALAGLADTYTELFLTRIGVGVSEACIFPVSYSLIGDYFSAKRMARAISIFTLSSQLGSGFSLIGSGLVIASAGGLADSVPILASREVWQIAFIVIGLPGVLFALALLTIREPARDRNPNGEDADRPMALREVFAYLRARRSFYLSTYLAIGGVAVVQLGIPSWFPAYLLRVLEMSPTRTGYELGITSIVFGSLGPLSGPFLASYLERRGYGDAPPRAAAFCTIGMTVFAFALPYSPDPTFALLMAGLLLFFSGAAASLTGASMQNATPGRMRGVTASLFTFSVQIIGYMIGPTLIAFMTDTVFGDPKMIGHSLQVVLTIASIVTGLALIGVMRSYRVIASGQG